MPLRLCDLEIRGDGVARPPLLLRQLSLEVHRAQLGLLERLERLEHLLALAERDAVVYFAAYCFAVRRIELQRDLAFLDRAAMVALELADAAEHRMRVGGRLLAHLREVGELALCSVEASQFLEEDRAREPRLALRQEIERGEQRFRVAERLVLHDGAQRL